MRSFIGGTILVLGLLVLIFSVITVPSGVRSTYMLGYFMPPTVLIAIGMLVLFWKTHKDGSQ
jgi:hypothetical protein